METVTCPKCDGSKHISGFEHIASGVCFCCGGSGLIQLSAEASRQAEEREAANRAAKIESDRKRKWLLAATATQLQSLSWPQLWSACQFASNCLACGEHTLEAVHAELAVLVERATS